MLIYELEKKGLQGALKYYKKNTRNDATFIWIYNTNHKQNFHNQILTEKQVGKI